MSKDFESNFQGKIWENHRHEYVLKSDFLVNECSSFLSPIDPILFYRNLFPEGFLEKRGEMINWDREGGGKPNAIAILITDRKKEKVSKSGKVYDKPIVKRETITDDLSLLNDLIAESQDNLWPLYIAPVSYFGKSRSAANARYLHAFTIDLDGVGISQLRNLIEYVKLDWLPMPTELVLSGRGVHLYFRLEDPIPLIPRNVAALQEIKRHLIDLMWNSKTSTIPSHPENNQRQYQGIYQPFRVPGSATKVSGFKPEHKRNKHKLEYLTIAFQFTHKDPYSIDELIGWLDTYETKVMKSDKQKVLDLFNQTDRTPLSVAKEKWPDWYERRVVNNEPRATFTFSRACYDKWHERISSNVKVGCRYNRIMTLAAYAAKCGIDFEELEEDALSLFEPFNEVLDSKTHERVEFELDELYSALDTYYDSKAITYTNAFMSRRAGLPIAQGARRNGRSQEQHLKLARFARDMNYEDGCSWRDGNGRPKGSKNKNNQKRDLIINYKKEHPEANHSEIARALGISRPTVIKWLKKQEIMIS